VMAVGKNAIDSSDLQFYL